MFLVYVTFQEETQSMNHANTTSPMLHIVLTESTGHSTKGASFRQGKWQGMSYRTKANSYKQ